MGIGDWGLGIGDWGLGPIPNPQSPIPIIQTKLNYNNFNLKNIYLSYFKLKIYWIFMFENEFWKICYSIIKAPWNIILISIYEIIKDNRALCSSPLNFFLLITNYFILLNFPQNIFILWIIYNRIQIFKNRQKNVI